MSKIRADQLLVKKNITNSREKAKRLIMSGEVLVGTRRIDKAGELLDEDCDIKIKNPLTYVSRGGLKLEKILDTERIDLSSLVCCDIGASTGGFTDCMLQRGAKKVYAIDVGYNQLDYKLRMDSRVVVMERQNIRDLDPQLLGDVNFISIDVSFISLKLVLPVAKEILKNEGSICALIKPQFEAGRENVGKGGIVRDKKVRLKVLEDFLILSEELGLSVKNIIKSPIKGAKGNVEFLAHVNNYGKTKTLDLRGVVEDAD